MPRRFLLLALPTALTLLVACAELTSAVTPNAPTNLTTSAEPGRVTLTW